MVRLRFPHLVALFGAVIALPGCFQSDSSPNSASEDVAAEEAAIQSVIFEEAGELTDPDVLYYDDDASLDGPLAAPIATVAWRRELLDLERTIAIVFHRSDTKDVATADVTITADAVGLLHLLVSDGDVANRYTKDFSDSGTRQLYFERIRPLEIGRRHRGWQLVAMSGVAIKSPGTTRAIHSVRLQAGTADETITDVTALMRLESLPVLPAGSEVTVTVDTGDATDHVYLHRRFLRKRMELTSNGDGTFSGTYLTGDRVGARHIAIDVLSHDTLYDDVAPYDNVAWGIPYRVAMDTGETP